MSSGHQVAGNENHPEEAKRKEHFLAQAHQLVVAEPRDSRPDPAEYEEEQENLDADPDPPGYPVEDLDLKRGQPPAEEQDRVERANEEDVGVFAEPEQRDAHRRVFDLV